MTMKSIAATIGTLVIALGLGGTALAGPQQRTASKAKLAHHHRRHHRRHMHTGIGPGGDQDGDNHGAPSDGDGNL
jgi:hypothetical protein